MLPQHNARTYQLNSRVRFRKVSDDGVVLNLDSGRVIVVNEQGLLIVQNLSSPVTGEALSELVASHYDVSRDQARSDVLKYLDELEEENLLKISSSGEAVV